VLNHVSRRPHLSPRVLAFASATKAPNCNGWLLIYLHQRDGRLSWPSWLTGFKKSITKNFINKNGIFTDPR